MRRVGTVLGLLILMTVSGCASGISGQARSQVTYHGSFAELQQAPGQYVGEVAMLGGEIIETTPAESGSQVVALQLPLSGSERPERDKGTRGRFIVRTERFLDPAIYKKGALLTVVGRISGSEVKPIGSFQYAYPVIDAIELKIWPEESGTSPSIHFGIGFGTWF